jgi:hypothetical protein
MALDSLTAKANTGDGTDALAGKTTGQGFVGAVLLTDANGAEITASNGLPVAMPAMTASTYNVAGVIAINTDLLIIDCQNLEGVSIQCTSMGTTGVVTPNWSNNGTTFVAATLTTTVGTAVSTFNAAGMWTTPVLGRYLRLRLTTATTGGTTTLAVQGIAQASNFPVAQQIITGTVTASGTVTATVTPPAPATPYFVNSAASTNGALILTGTSSLHAFYATNEGASPAYVKLYNKATAPTVGTDIPEMTIPVPAAASGVPGVANPMMGFLGFRFALGLGIAITRNAVYTDTTAIGAGEVKVKLSRAV